MANHERTSGHHPQWLHQIPAQATSSARIPVDLSCLFLSESTYWIYQYGERFYDKDRANSEKVPEASCSFVFIRG